MKIFTDIDLFVAKNPVVTIGTFDGVHLGHRKVIERLNEIAHTLGGESVIFTFYPHPRMILAPEEDSLRLLTTLEEKEQLFELAGVDHLIVYPFSKEFAELTYSEFVKNVLVDQLKTKCLVVGYDHKFGKNREGGFDFLQNCADKHRFLLEKLDALMVDNANVSSTKIRTALQEGNIDKANEFLGYRFTLHGTVVEGQQLGRKIQFPTANIEASDPHKIIPGYGVYAVTAYLNGTVHKGMLNIGTRPTVNNNADHRSIEVHLFDFHENIYGHQIELTFYHKIREEQKFSSIEVLKAQLEIDKQEILLFLEEI